MTSRLVFLLCVFLGLALWAESQEMPEACWRRGALRHAVVGVSVKRVSDGMADTMSFTAISTSSQYDLIVTAPHNRMVWNESRKNRMAPTIKLWGVKPPSRRHDFTRKNIKLTPAIVIKIPSNMLPAEWNIMLNNAPIDTGF